jgi:hypothetical protein
MESPNIVMDIPSALKHLMSVQKRYDNKLNSFDGYNFYQAYSGLVLDLEEAKKEFDKAIDHKISIKVTEILKQVLTK